MGRTNTAVYKSGWAEWCRPQTDCMRKEYLVSEPHDVMKSAVCLALLFAAGALAQGDVGMPPGDGDGEGKGNQTMMLPCQRFGEEVVEIMDKMQEIFKDVFEEGLR